jgi:hypothetical protein
MVAQRGNISTRRYLGFVLTRAEQDEKDGAGEPMRPKGTRLRRPISANDLFSAHT